MPKSSERVREGHAEMSASLVESVRARAQQFLQRKVVARCFMCVVLSWDPTPHSLETKRRGVQCDGYV